MRLENLIEKVNDFAEKRDWDQFHSPKNLSMALSAESGELLDIFQWLKEEESLKDNLDDNLREEAKDELADIFIYLIRLSQKLDIDLIQAANSKLDDNKKKYPIELSKGNATKYNRR
ncbi:nucleotide pyrophosphohydrolase [Fodinibius saliphilus]|uniref:nucleotide pyrophosphohydrolase n=1 Tax=Fodinibius saliphilus TaxID=1920650 RepID=UPI001107CB84|nr:nucleotide pyrophosphohydrolase [Fodinibius saliphilus]